MSKEFFAFAQRGRIPDSCELGALASCRHFLSITYFAAFGECAPPQRPHRDACTIKMNPPPDPFETLALPARPWLAPEILANAYRAQAKRLHPDGPDGDAVAFQSLGAARDLLADPASRLELLATRVDAGEKAPSGTPTAAAEFGFRIGPVVQEAAAAITRSRATSEKLERALALNDIAASLQKLKKFSHESSGTLLALDKRTRKLDFHWPDVVTAADLLALAREWLFAQRAHSQLRKIIFAAEQVLAEAKF